MNYPSPCKTCQKEHCNGLTCSDWLVRYRYRQKQINIKALQIARGETPIKTDVWVYMHPDEYRRYLEANPCEGCFAAELCVVPCQRYLLWYDAHRERTRRRLNDDL